MNTRLFKVGVVGTVVSALCCFTPVLFSLLAAVGLSWLLGWIDYIVLPAMAFFIGLTIYALAKKSKSEGT